MTYLINSTPVAKQPTASAKSDVQIIEFVDSLLKKGIQQQASDIHFELFADRYQIRIRVDGVLRVLDTLTPDVAPRIIARLKILAKLDIAEKRIPQDGHFSLLLGFDSAINFRISTCPTNHGEKIVLRILENHAEQIQLDDLGLLPSQKRLLEHTLSHPHGMMIVTGPTGSGKTITLYAALKALNQPHLNICSVEDPIEVDFPGINQVATHAKIGLDFSYVLRAFLRQDPDIIMVGEIRDHETADIAIKAAQTGHLVLSTLHTNNAIDSLTRLQHLGIHAYNIATALRIIIAQRLVRKLCLLCRKPIHYSKKVLENWGMPEHITLYEAHGCEQCHDGYRGRLGIFEVLELSDTLQTLVAQQAPRNQLYEYAKSNGFIDLIAAANEKLKQGLTSVAELQRVIDADYFNII